MARLKKERVGETKPFYLTREQFDSLVHTIEADATMKAEGIVDGEESKHTNLKDGEILWLVDVVKVAVGTGLRISELCNLRWTSVNLTDGHLTVRNVRGFKTKSGNERAVPFEGETAEVFQRLKASRTGPEDGYVFRGTSTRANSKEKLDPGYVSKRFKKYARKAKLPKEVTFHTLRHTYASWLVMAGVSLYVVQRLLGHASIEMTMIYAHLAPDQFKQAVNLVFGKKEKPKVRRSRGRVLRRSRVVEKQEREEAV